MNSHRPRPFRLVLESLEDRAVPAASTIIDNGPASNRVDIVFLGDGYTAGELDTAYPVHIASAYEHMFNEGEDPFPRYRNFFNVHRVDVISNQSGIDNPSDGIFRDTALDGTYDAFNIARLITVNDAKANVYLAQAPATADIRMVTTNSTEYGGSGGYYAVYAGGDPASAEIALHELGHSFDNLADEYWYFDGSTYTGGEPENVNLTTSPTGAKWTEWLGYNQPGIGIIGAYEGGGYNDFGLYRPSVDSKMRSLDRPFDAISREKIIQDIYALVDPLDAWRGNGSTLGTGASLWVQVVDPSVLQTEWRVDGNLVSGAEGSNFRPSDFGFTAGTHTVTARTFDPTDWVRRGLGALEQTRTWTIDAGVTPVGVRLLETDNLTELDEGGTADSYSLVLDSQPTADVVITLAPDDQLNVVPTTVTFTPANWNVPQTVQVRANLDAAVEGLHLGRVDHLVTSADARYDALPMPSLVAIVHDVAPSVGIVVTPTSGLVTTESGGQATFTVALTSMPLTAVTIDLSSSNPALGTVSPATLTFTPGNAFTPQTVTITGQNDGINDGDHPYTIITSPASSADPDYNALDSADVSVLSDGPLQTAGITVTPTSGLTTTEAGGQATFTIVLQTAPTATVTINLASSNPALGTASPATLTFTPGDALTPQTVTITGHNDGIDDGDHPYTILTAAASSADPDYDGLDADDVSVLSDGFLADSDIIVSPTSGLLTAENGLQATFTVFLTGAPTADVTIDLSSSIPSLGTVSPATLTFTPANGLVPQTVTITGHDDGIAGSATSYTIVVGAASSGDLRYDGADPADLSVASVDYLPKKATFIDDDGDVYTLVLGGPGRMLRVGDGGLAPVGALYVEGTDSLKSRLKIKVKRAAGGDGLVTIGSIAGSGLKSIAAPKSDLVGDGIDLTGRLGKLKIRDLLTGTAIRASGTPSEKTAIAAHQIMDGVAIDLGTTISSLKAAAIGDGMIEAAAVGKLIVRGDKKAAIVGHLEADIDLAGTADPKKPLALGKVQVAGDILAGDWTINGGVGSIKARNWLDATLTADSLGSFAVSRTVDEGEFTVAESVGKFTAGAFLDSELLVGYTPTDPLAPFAGGTFAAGADLKTFRIVGIKGDPGPAFAGSVVAADSFGTVLLASIDTSAVPVYGLLADESIAHLTIKTPSLKLKDVVSDPTLDGTFGDFAIKFV